MSLKAKICKTILEDAAKPKTRHVGQWYRHGDYYSLLASVCAMGGRSGVTLVGLDGIRFSDPVPVNSVNDIGELEWSAISCGCDMSYMGE